MTSKISTIIIIIIQSLSTKSEKVTNLKCERSQCHRKNARLYRGTFKPRRLESSNANSYIRSHSHSFGKFIPNCRCGVTKGISGEVKSCWTVPEDVCTARP